MHRVCFNLRGPRTERVSVNLLFRAVLVIAGLVFALSLLVVMIMLLAVWSLRALWCKLTGQRVNPFVMRMNPQAGFDRVFRPDQSRAAGGASGPPNKPSRRVDNVTDVEPKL
jgi:flagellar biosynthesis protein FlhB